MGKTGYGSDAKTVDITTEYGSREHELLMSRHLKSQHKIHY